MKIEFSIVGSLAKFSHMSSFRNGKKQAIFSKSAPTFEVLTLDYLYVALGLYSIIIRALQKKFSFVLHLMGGRRSASMFNPPPPPLRLSKMQLSWQRIPNISPVHRSPDEIRWTSLWMSSICCNGFAAGRTNNRFANQKLQINLTKEKQSGRERGS